MGYLGLAVEPSSPWLEFVAIAFGIGMGLTLDEFALWLNLEDVYWKEKGRQSIDAVVVTTALLAIALLGLQFWIDVYDAVLVLLGLDRGNAWIAIPVQVAGVASRWSAFAAAAGCSGCSGCSCRWWRLSGRPCRGGHRHVPARDHAPFALVAERRERAGVELEEGALLWPQASQRAVSTRSTWPWANTATSPSAPSKEAIVRSTRRPTSAAVSPPGQPSRHRYHPGRRSRISAVVIPSYSP